MATRQKKHTPAEVLSEFGVEFLFNWFRCIFDVPTYHAKGGVSFGYDFFNVFRPL